MTPAKLTIEIEAAMNRLILAQSDRMTKAIHSGGTSRDVTFESARMLGVLEMKEAINEALHNIQPDNQTTAASVCGTYQTVSSLPQTKSRALVCTGEPAG